MAVNLQTNIEKILGATKGKEARKPISQSLDAVNESGGRALSIIDGEGNSFMLKDIRTPEQVYQCFKEGDYYVTKVSQDFYDGKVPITSGGLYSHLETLSKLLDKIING